MAGMGGGEVPVRRAATVALVRDSPSGVEAFVLRRVAGMAFAGGMTVFPGGGVDDRDLAPVPFAGRPADWWSDRLGLPTAEASAVLSAALRELFEETGVLLGAGAPTSAREQLRLDVTAHRIGLVDVLGAERIAAAFDDLVPWARWITPPGPPRRFDTYFFVAALPSDQQAELLTSEAELGDWVAPAQLLADYRKGDRPMMPPTLAVLTQLAAAGTLADLLAVHRQITPVRPVVLSAPGERLRVSLDGWELEGDT